MDRFKIEFRCKTEPKSATGLSGFKANQMYRGRSYNGLYEVDAAWGKGGVSKIIDKKTFETYFELLPYEEPVSV